MLEVQLKEQFKELSRKFWSPEKIGPGGTLFNRILVRRWKIGPP